MKTVQALLGPKWMEQTLLNYSWDAKMRVCGRYAGKVLCDGRRWQAADLKNRPTPWELNQFAAYAALYRDGTQSEIPDLVFLSMINVIRNRPPSRKMSSLDDIKKYLSFETAMVQFPYQQDAILIFFRYRYLLSFVDASHGIDMPALFKKTFGVDYSDVAAFSVLVHLAATVGQYWPLFISDFCKKYKCRPSSRFFEIVEMFSIDREEYARKQDALFSLSTDGSANAENLMEIYPFLRMGNTRSLPLPYLLNQAMTRHLFDRLMKSNKGLRAKVGRWVMEPYLQWLFRRSGCYDAVDGSFQYRCSGQIVDSPDVIVRQGELTVFVEVKLSEAPLVLRQANEVCIEKTLQLAAQFIYQLYARMNELCKGYAKPRMEVESEKTFGIVVVHEDSYAVREDIYARCFARHPELSVEDREFIRRRISFVGLYSVEQFCYSHRSIVPALEKRMEDAPGSESIMLDVDFLEGSKADYPFDDGYNLLAKEIPLRLFIPNACR